QSSSTQDKQDNSSSSSSNGNSSSSQSGASQSTDTGQDNSVNTTPVIPTTPPGTFTQYGYDSGSTQPSPAGPQPVFTHPEQLPSLSTLNEATANTGLNLTVSAGASADSNASGQPGTNWLGLGLLQATMGITQIRPKFSWNFNYGGSTLLTLNSSVAD